MPVLVNRCRHLIFTTALPPVVGQWWLQVLAQVRGDHPARAALHAATTDFRAALHRRGIEAGGTDQVVPLVIGDDALAVVAAAGLQARGFDVRAIRPPTVPAGTARLRVSIHADHDPATLARLADALEALLPAPTAP